MMYKYKVHCNVRGSLKNQIVYIEAPDNNKTSVISAVLKQYPKLKPVKIYYIGIVKKPIQIEEKIEEVE